MVFCSSLLLLLFVVLVPLKLAGVVLPTLLAQYLRRTKRCMWFFDTWDSPKFWRRLPWYISVAAMGFMSYATLLVVQPRIDVLPSEAAANGDSSGEDVFVSWLLTFAVGAVTFVLLDPVVIIARNNLGSAWHAVLRSNTVATIHLIALDPISRLVAHIGRKLGVRQKVD